MNPLRVAVLLSGSGTTLQNLVDHFRGEKAVQFVLVVSDRPGVQGLERASREGISTALVRRDECASLDEFSRKIFDHCRAVKADLVCMGGFLRLVRVPVDFTNRVMNIHPALIPAFSGKGFHGLNVHRAVLESGVKFSGCTVHFADNQYDHGPILLQKVVPVLDDDTPEKIGQRVFEAECLAYPEALRLFAGGKIKVEGRRVKHLV